MEIEISSLKATIVFQRNLLSELQELILTNNNESSIKSKTNMLSNSKEKRFNNWLEYAMKYLNEYSDSNQLNNNNYSIFKCNCIYSLINCFMFIPFTKKWIEHKHLRWVASNIFIIHHVKDVCVVFLNKLNEIKSSNDKYILCEWMEKQLHILGFDFINNKLSPLNAHTILSILFEI